MKANTGSDARICDPFGEMENRVPEEGFRPPGHINISLDYFFLAAFLLLFQAVASNITGVPMKRDA